MKTELKTIYLDASFIISGLIQRHQFNQECSKILKNLKRANAKLYISQLTLDEVLHILNRLYKIPKNKVAINLNTIISNSGIQIVQENIDSQKKAIQYLEFWKKSNLKPRDAMHIFLMKQNKIKTIATFDQDFIKYKKELKINTL